MEGQQIESVSLCSEDGDSSHLKRWVRQPQNDSGGIPSQQSVILPGARELTIEYGEDFMEKDCLLT
jgi:transposase-like protein